MNANTKNELAEVAATQSAVDAMAVVTLSPEKYAAEVYQPFKAKLADAIDSVRAIEYDITTTAGMAVAVKARALFRDMRVAADKERKARKEPITKIGKLLESGFDQVEERITPLEELFDGDIKAEESRKEVEKAAKIAAERARTEAIEARIQAIRNVPLAMVGKSSIEIMAARDAVRDTIISEELFGEQTYRDKAVEARSDAFNALEAAYTAATEAEAAALAAEEARKAEVARIAAEREELAQLRAAAVERDRLAKIESDRIAAEQAKEAKRLADIAAEQDRQREAEAARLRADEESRAAVLAEQQRQIAAQQAALEAQQAAFAQQQAEAQKRAEDAAKLEVDHLEALGLNIEFDAEADRARLQTITEKAIADANALPASLDELMASTLPRPESVCERDARIDANIEEGMSDEDIIEFGKEWGLTGDAFVARMEKFVVDQRELAEVMG